MNTGIPTDLPEIPDSEELIAAEYVLGLLDAEARRDAQARLQRDDAFAARVEAWEAYFSPWLQAIAPVDAPTPLWPSIQRALWSHELPVHNAPAGDVRLSLWNRLSFWRGLAGGGFAVAAASLVALVVGLRQLPPATTPALQPVVTTAQPAAAPMVVSLRHDDGTMAYTATVDPDTGVITLIPAFMPEDQRVPELWMIDSTGTPHSLGVVGRDHAMRVLMPKQFLSQTKPDTVFAVSMEPAGGSPTGQPTGPVVAKGSLVRL